MRMNAKIAPPATHVWPPVSVVIPAYNYARYLPAAIESVLTQDYPEFETIVVDDGSTDDTPAVLRRYADRLRVIAQANAGLSAARNAGVRAARHAVVALLDADDCWKPGLLRRLMGTLTTLPATFGVIACLQTMIDAEGRPVPRKPQRDARLGDREIAARDIVLKTRFGSSGVVVRKACFETCGYFDTALRGSEDRDFWLRVAARHRIYLLTEPLTQVRNHAGSMSKDPERMRRSVRQVLWRAFRRGAAPRWRLDFWLRVIAFYQFESAWMYHDAGRPGIAVGKWGLSLLAWPWFGHPGALNEPPLFRARALRHFLGGAAHVSPGNGGG